MTETSRILQHRQPPNDTDETQTKNDIPEDEGPYAKVYAALLIGTGGVLLGAAWVQECLQMLLTILGALQLVAGTVLLMLSKSRPVFPSAKHTNDDIPTDDGAN